MESGVNHLSKRLCQEDSRRMYGGGGIESSSAVSRNTRVRELTFGNSRRVAIRSMDPWRSHGCFGQLTDDYRKDLNPVSFCL